MLDNKTVRTSLCIGYLLLSSLLPLSPAPPGHLVNEDTAAHSHEEAQPWLLAWCGAEAHLSLTPMPDTVPDPRG